MLSFHRTMFALRAIAPLAGLLLVSCGGANSAPTVVLARHDERQCARRPYESPHGARTDYVAPEIEGVVIAEPKVCEHGNAYIRVTRTRGWRKLGLLDTERGQGCTTLPADPSERSCETLNGGALLVRVEAELRARHVEINGPANGPCGKVEGDYDGWNLSVGVVDWRDAATAVQLVAGELERYDVGDHLGVAVRGIVCWSPL